MRPLAATGERVVMNNHLLRSMLDTLKSGDILLGDAFYATYFMLCDLQQRGVDACVRAIWRT